MLPIGERYFYDTVQKLEKRNIEISYIENESTSVCFACDGKTVYKNGYGNGL